ncbi:glycoside hydrolase family 28 protein [Shimia sp. NS0008-38b]|uniref:polygalacturonase PglA n=1 Tax=Shimia sp. NS0008-38b TaxID=3127653 RepID=UPI00333F8B19
MTALRVLGRCAYSASMLIVSGESRFYLEQAMDWLLTDGTGATVQSGKTTAAGLYLDRLTPDSEYFLTVGDADIRFSTLQCTKAIDPRDFGADPSAEDNQFAFQAAIDAVPAGGALIVPKGVFCSGPIFLKSHMTLHLSEGATLAAISSRDNWEILPARNGSGRVLGTWEGAPADSYAGFITAIDSEQLRITGKGTIDGGGDRGDWWSWPKETRNGARRPRTVFLAHCNSVVMAGVTVRNSPSWTVHPFHCVDTSFSNLSIQNPSESPNTDGLNPESCCRVDISAVHFSVGDDCIAIKAGKRLPDDNSHLAPTSDVTIAHCLMEFGHGAVVLGSEMSGNITNTRVEHCDFRRTDRGLRIKTRRGRGGRVSDVHLKNVVMDRVPTPFAINAHYFCDPDGHEEWVQSRALSPVNATTPKIKDITLEDVTANNAATAGAALLGLPESPITGVSLTNYHVCFDGQASPAVPLMASDVEAVLGVPLLVEHATVTTDNFSTQTHEDTARC